MVRERQFNLIVGAPGHGKSTFAANLIDRVPDRDALIYKMHLNIEDKAFKKFPYTADLSKYIGGKTIVSDGTIEYLDLLRLVLKKFRNGQLAIDDAGLFERDIISQELNRIVIMRRHIGIDVTMIYHGLTMLPIQQYPYINHIVLFHTTDEFSFKAKKLPNFKQLMQAKERIALQVERGNKYYHEIIKFAA